MTEEAFYDEFKRFWSEKAGNDPDLIPFRLELDPTYHFVKPWETPTGHPAVQETIEAYRRYSGIAPAVGGAAFSCDLGIYGEVGGMPSIILGPRGDNLHAPYEWVLLEDIFTLTGIYALLAVRWCG